MFNESLFDNLAFYEIMWEHFVQRGRQMTIWRMRIACWMPNVTTVHTHSINNLYCSSTATIIARTRLNVTFYMHGLSCYKFRKSLEIVSKDRSGPTLAIRTSQIKSKRRQSISENKFALTEARN